MRTERERATEDVAHVVTGAFRGDELVVTLAGEIDIAAKEHIEQFISLEVEAVPKTLVIDMSRVTFVDSSGLSILIRAQRAVAEHGGVTIIRDPNPMFRTLLEVTGLGDLVTVLVTPSL